MNMIGSFVLSLMWRPNSNPDPSGSPISEITRSQFPSSNFFSARCLVSTHATSYFSRSRRSCKVAPSDRSSSTSNSRFIIGTHTSGMLFLGKHAGGVCAHSFRQIQLSYEAALFSAAKLNRTAHRLRQLTHDIKSYAAAAAARVAHKQFAELTQIS